MTDEHIIKLEELKRLCEYTPYRFYNRRYALNMHKGELWIYDVMFHKYVNVSESLRKWNYSNIEKVYSFVIHNRII